jgi:two-component SAPR family response regulator
MRRVLVLTVLLVAPVWSLYSLIQLSAANFWPFHRPFEFSPSELILILHLLICLIAIWIAVEWTSLVVRQKHYSKIVHVPSSNGLRALLMFGLSFVAHQPSTDGTVQTITEEDSTPIGLVLSPAMATLLINDILRRRREQIRRRAMPDVFSEMEQNLLSDVQELAKNDAGHRSIEELDCSQPIVQDLTNAVERIGEVTFVPTEEPLLVVHLYGYPEVRAVDGQSATFRKKRALELVVWLSLNRDRPRRSAARTALWQVDVSDSTFSTIVSDMRRGIADVALSLERSEIVPTTYSDELVLSKHVTTDYDLLRSALHDFREEPTNYRNLVGELKGIRDSPFSGTAYEWADLDGTTTRLIITAMQAVHELAEYARTIGDEESMQIAVAAGLRVMPGNEELLQLQKSILDTGQFVQVGEICK